MIVYSPNPNSIIKACLLSRLRQQPCQVKEENKHTLFCGQDEIPADSFTLEQLIAEYRRKYNKELSWLIKKESSRLYGRINYALRSSSPARFAVIENALRDSFCYGLDYCLNSISADCRKFNNLGREVAHEVRRMMGLIRFSVFGEDEKTLVAVPRLYHNTADLILKKFAPRYPGCKLVLVLEKKALCLDNGTVFPVDAACFRSFLQKKDSLAGVWEEYYRSQYIESRKNIRLAGQHIPQKYWDWLTEGKILEEAKKEKL